MGHISTTGSKSTYRFEIGPIDWDGRRLSAVIVSGFPLEGGLEVRSIVVNRILAEHPDVAEGAWTVFIKRPPNLPWPEWELIGSGQGRQSLAGRGSARQYSDWRCASA
jgi:hypothetical protein